MTAEKLIAKQRELIKLLDTEPDDYNREIDSKESKLRKKIAILEKKFEREQVILYNWKHLPESTYKDEGWHIPNKRDFNELIRDELLAFNSWMLGKQYDGKIPLIKTCIDEYLSNKQKP